MYRPFSRLSFIFTMATFFLLSSCTKDKLLAPTTNPGNLKKYLHLSHTRKDTNPDIDEVAKKINYSLFDMLLLGGDLAHLTSLDSATLAGVDAVFDLGNPNTLWALGNHDYSDLSLIKDYTKRPPYYTYTNNGICFLVLDTQDSMSNIIGDQKALFDQVTDTIQYCSHLIILHHKLIEFYDNPILEPLQWTVSNAAIGQLFYQINPNNFYTDIYPRLQLVKQKGIEVICLAGDLGYYTSEFEYKTTEGIYFLGSGINAGSQNNKALLFQHNTVTRELSWEFLPITSFDTL